MKTIITLLCCLVMLSNINAKNVTVNYDTIVTVNQKDSTIKSDTIKKEMRKDTTRIVLGKKEIRIIDSEQGTDVKIRDKDGKEEEFSDSKKKNSDDFKFDFDKKDKKKDDTRFKGHWSGVSFGLNGFMNKDMNMSLTGSDQFMSINTNPLKSMNVNVNFGQVNIGLIGKSVGLVTGLGFQFNNYAFENNSTIMKGANGNTIADSSFILDGIHLDKNKLTLMYFTVPLLLEVKFPKMAGTNKRIWLSGGLLASIKLNSHTKVVYHDNGDRKKDKNRDDFNISALRYGFTARAGYSDFYVYGDYFPTQFFEKNKGPELYPFAVGVGFKL